MRDKHPYDSKACFQGKRVADIQYLAEQLFEESLLSIEVDHHEKEFIVRLDHRINPIRAEKFEADHKMCRLVIYKEITLQALKAGTA